MKGKMKGERKKERRGGKKRKGGEKRGKRRGEEKKSSTAGLKPATLISLYIQLPPEVEMHAQTYRESRLS